MWEELITPNFVKGPLGNQYIKKSDLSQGQNNW
jgi:hypothetical protein